MACVWQKRGDGKSECTREGCDNVIAADCEVVNCHAVCKAGSQPKLPADAPRKPTRRPPEEQLTILNICHACEHCIDADPDAGLRSRARCGEITRIGKTKGRKSRGHLMHPRGIPSPTSRCPLGEWGPEETT